MGDPNTPNPKPDNLTAALHDVQVTKSLKTLIMNASLGAGSELEIEIAKGVDWTAILAIILGVKQVSRLTQSCRARACILSSCACKHAPMS